MGRVGLLTSAPLFLLPPVPRGPLVVVLRLTTDFFFCADGLGLAANTGAEVEMDRRATWLVLGALVQAADCCMSWRRPRPICKEAGAMANRNRE